MCGAHTNWWPNDIVKIQAPTGTGKTTYILSVLRAEAVQKNQNIVYFHNRKLLGRQMKTLLGKEIGWGGDGDELNEIQCFDGIRICTYQSLQTMLTKGARFSLGDCLYVVFDEIHYILRDSLFQPEIARFLDWLRFSMLSSHPVWIFISATLDMTWDFLCAENHIVAAVAREYAEHCALRQGVHVYVERNVYGLANFRPRCLWEYQLEADYSSVETFYYQELEALLPSICDENSGKWLIFVSSKKQGTELANCLSAAIGIQNVRYLDADGANNQCDVMLEIISEQKFAGKVLVATSVLDNGVSLWDMELRNIVLSTLYHDDFLQMLGRKRRLPDEKINVFLPAKNLKCIVGEWYLKVVKNLEYSDYPDYQVKAELLTNEELYQFARRFMYYDTASGVYRVNPAGMYMLCYMERFTAYLRQGMSEDKWFFVREQLRWLGKSQEIDFGRFVDFQERRKALEQECLFLDSIKGRMLDNAQQQLLSVRMACLARAPKKLKTYGKFRINQFFQKEGLPFEIQSRVINRKAFWVVVRTEVESNQGEGMDS